MADLNKSYKDLIKTLEDKIGNKEDLKEIKEKLSNLVVLFMDKIDKVITISDDKVQALLSRQKGLEDRINKLEIVSKNIEKDIYLDDGYDFEIVCPYCNNEFVTDIEDLSEEIKCPECNNIIELDWSAEEDHCGNGCSHCHSKHEEELEEENVEEDDDM